MATGSTPHRISRRLRLGFCDSPHDGVIARERGRPARILSPHFSPGAKQGAPSAVCSRRSLERHQSRC